MFQSFLLDLRSQNTYYIFFVEIFRSATARVLPRLWATIFCFQFPSSFHVRVTRARYFSPSSRPWHSKDYTTRVDRSRESSSSLLARRQSSKYCARETYRKGEKTKRPNWKRKISLIFTWSTCAAVCPARRYGDAGDCRHYGHLRRLILAPVHRSR